jgi:hypothetical protein
VGNFAHLKEQAAGRRSRQAVLDYLLEVMTSPANPATVEQLNECSMALFHFEGTLLAEIDRVSRSYSEPKEREVLALLLGIALRALEKLA